MGSNDERTKDQEEKAREIWTSQAWADLQERHPSGRLQVSLLHLRLSYGGEMTGTIAFIVGVVLGSIAGAFVIFSWVEDQYRSGNRIFWINNGGGKWK